MFRFDTESPFKIAHVCLFGRDQTEIQDKVEKLE